MTKDEALQILDTIPTISEQVDALEMAIKALEQQPSDTVSRGAFEQVMWERDVAIGQLKELGYGLGQKVEPCDDVVSREAAITIAGTHTLTVDETVKALEQLPSVTPKPIECDDAISREDTLKAIIENLGIRSKEYLLEAEKVVYKTVENMPPVTPQQKSGKWILLDECTNSGYYCSNCQKKLVKEGWSQTVKKIKYCPNCGARMESEE